MSVRRGVKEDVGRCRSQEEEEGRGSQEEEEWVNGSTLVGKPVRNKQGKEMSQGRNVNGNGVLQKNEAMTKKEREERE